MENEPFEFEQFRSQLEMQTLEGFKWSDHVQFAACHSVPEDTRAALDDAWDTLIHTSARIIKAAKDGTGDAFYRG